MKSISLLLISFGFVVSTSAQSINYAWNTKKVQIRQQEEQLVSQKPQQLVFRDKWQEHTVIKKYGFFNNKLKRAAIILKQSYHDQNQYIFDYKQISRNLSRKYGDPHKSNARIPINKKLASDPNLSEGEKLATGAIGFENKWKSSGMRVRHTLRGNGYEIIHVIVFTAPDYKQFADGF